MILSYDIRTLPKGMEMDGWYNIFNYFNIVLYDSTLGNIPELLDIEGEDFESIPENVLLLNLSNKEMLRKAKEITNLTFPHYEENNADRVS